MPEPLHALRPLLVYTMTSGLGDFIVMGDLARKVEKLCPGAQCIFLHRGNPHARLWRDDDRSRRFFDLYSAGGVASFVKRVKEATLDGCTSFGLQMAPGSLQGFLLYKLLKKMGLIDYIVDFNLINADIITPPEGEYILDLHLNQAARLLKLEPPHSCCALDLPFRLDGAGRGDRRAEKVVGLHPWSRRGDLACFVWPFEKWLAVIDSILDDGSKVVVFGKDKSFGSFESFIRNSLGSRSDQVEFRASRSVAELGGTIDNLDLLVSVNTSVVHIGYALKIPMVILSGPSLDLWIPKGPSIRTVGDAAALFGGCDRWTDDPGFPAVDRIDTERVLQAIKSLLVGEPGDL